MEIEIKIKLGDASNTIQDQLANYEYQFDIEVVNELNNYGLLIAILYANGLINLDTFKEIGNRIIERLKFHLYQYNHEIQLD